MKLTKAQKAELELLRKQSVEGMRRDAEQGHWLKSQSAVTSSAKTSAEQAAPDQTGSDGRYPPHFAIRPSPDEQMKAREHDHKVWAEAAAKDALKEPKGNQDK